MSEQRFGWTPADADEEPEFPAFDERAARRAIRRGVIRTAFAAALCLALAAFLVLIVATGWQRRGDRDDRFARVYADAFLVAHPDYDGERGGCCNSSLTTIQLILDVRPRTPAPVRSTHQAWLKLNLLGRIAIDSIPVLPETPVGLALLDGPATRGETRALLRRLPTQMLASAVVALAAPVDERGLRVLLRRHGVFVPPDPRFARGVAIFLEPPYPDAPPMGEDRFWQRWPLAWPRPSVEGFREWALRLDSDDDGNLQRLQLPPAHVIQEVADRGVIYGFVLDRVPLERVAGLLVDPAVRSVTVADVAFDLGVEPLG